MIVVDRCGSCKSAATVRDQRSYEMRASPRAARSVFSDASVLLAGVKDLATFMAE